MIRSFPLIAGVCLAFLASGISRKAHAETNFGQVAMHVAYMLQNQHYSRQDFDDAMSERMLENFLSTLDPRRVFFQAKDVEQFQAKYKTTLDDLILMRDISAAEDIYGIYKQRVKDRVEFVAKTVKERKFTFDSERTTLIKRDKANYPKDDAERNQLWLDIIEENLLQEILSDQAKADEKAKKAAEKKPEEKKSAPQEPERTPEERVIKDYERLIESIEENDYEDVVDMFLSSLSAAYDPHTEYMSVNEMDNFNIQMKHKLVGIGALLGLQDDVAQIQGIVVGGPADKQGELKLNDKVTGVAQGEADFVETKYMKLQKIVDMIRGTEGSTVRLRVNPAEDPSSTKIISIVRGPVELKEKLANAELILTPSDLGKPMKVGWINLSSFYADMEEGTVSTTDDVQKLLARLMKEGIDGLVLDLRGNGGGSLEEAIRLTGLFVPAGPVVQAKDWRGTITWRECENAKAFYEGPMIVLTDKTSASASEILAAALQDYRRALIVGDKSTFGKGTVQTILPVDRFMPFFAKKDRAGNLKVTIQKFYRIAGGSTQLKGVEPDLVLPSIRDVLDIGESSTQNPLPYDTIPARKYNLLSQNPLPVQELATRLQTRLDVNPEYLYIVDESKKLKERIDRNSVVINLAKRQEETAENKARREKQEAERSARAKEIAAKLGDDTFKVYHLTLDNVNDEKLVPQSAFTKEQSTGMKMAAKAEGEEDPSDMSRFPYGLEPMKLETMHIMQDYLELTRKSPTTAKTGEATAK